MAKTKPAQEFVPVQEIRNGVVVLKDKSMRAVLMVSSLNFALKSRDEQQAIIMQFQNFLNSLDFPIQILIQSRERDIRPYIALLEERQRAQLDDLMKIQISEYISFIKTFIENVNVMSKHFFVVVPYTPALISSTNDSDSPVGKILKSAGIGKQDEKPETLRLEQFEENRSQLNQRLSVVEQGLAATGIRTVPLGTEELVELFYKTLNPGELTKPTAAVVQGNITEEQLAQLQQMQQQ